MPGRTVIKISAVIVLVSMTVGCKGNATEGAMLFKRERCIYCHTFKGQGAAIGPDLTDVTKKRSDKWLRDQIMDPKLHYTDPQMPAHPYLSQKEVNSLIEFLKSYPLTALHTSAARNSVTSFRKTCFSSLNSETK